MRGCRAAAGVVVGAALAGVLGVVVLVGLTAPARAAAPCALKVVQVRGADVYVGRSEGCVLEPGASLRRAAGGEGALRVVTTSGTYALAEPVGEARWRVGEALAIGAQGSTVAVPAREEAPPEGWRAGPGARSQQLPASFWTEAVQGARPRRGTPAGGAAGGAFVPVAVVRGTLSGGATAVVDRSANSAGFVRPWVDSRLDITKPGGVPFAYRHRLRWQRRFAYDRAEQPWEGDEPEWVLRELSVSYAFLDDRLRAVAGRFAPIGVGGAETVDGGGVEGEVADGLFVGAFGGLLPHPTSFLPDVDAVGVGGYVRGRYSGDAVSLGGSLLLGGSAWKGTWDSTFADALLTLRAAKVVDVHVSSRMDVYTDYNPANRPVADLSRLYGTVRGRPLDWLEIGARYSLYRMVATKRRVDLWGSDYTLTGEPFQGVGLTARVDLPGRVTLDGWGDVDVADRPGLGFRAGGGVAWNLSASGAWRVAARYGFDDAIATRSHSVSGELRLGVTADLSLELGYRYLRYTYRALEDTAVEHDARFALDWQALASLYVRAETEWWTGDDVESLLAQGHVGWRF